MKKYLVILMSAVLLCGCDNSEELVFHKSETVSAVRSRSDRFQHLLLGSPSQPYAGTPPITLRTPELGEVQITGILDDELSQLYAESEKFDASQISSIGPHPARGPRQGRDVWGSDAWRAEILRDKAVSIDVVVKNGMILGVSIYGGSGKGSALVEVKTGDSKWHAFPLTNEDLSDLFGGPRASYQWMAE